MKLIKINTDHYVVVDNSEVRPGDYVYTSVTNKVVKFTDPRHFSDGTYFKITHSTQPVETSNEVWEDSFKRYDYITLQEIKENFCWLDGTEWEVEFVDGKLKLR